VRECDSRRMVTRVKGKPVLLAALMRLRIRVERFATRRATRREDVLWAEGLGDVLDEALCVARGGGGKPPTEGRANGGVDWVEQRSR
jgi:hypothetical protein